MSLSYIAPERVGTRHDKKVCRDLYLLCLSHLTQMKIRNIVRLILECIRFKK